MGEMNGAWIGNRAIRCNWANQKSGTGVPGTAAPGTSYEEVYAQAAPSNTTVYVGNLAPDVSEELLSTIFHTYGPIEEVRIQREKGFGFVKFQNHDQATRAIISVNGTMVGSRPVRCFWGKERAGASTTTTTTSAPTSQAYGYYPYGQNYMYNMPYPYQYSYPPGDPAQMYPPGSYDPYSKYFSIICITGLTIFFLAAYYQQYQQQGNYPPR